MSLREVKKCFFALPQKEQEVILKEIYNFSKDIKNFLNVRLLNDGEGAYIEEIKKASASETSSGMPRDISVKQVNNIISKAKKSNVSSETLCEMEWLAFDGYMTFLNDFGGGPKIYEEKIYDHLEQYLLLLLKISKNESLLNELNGVKQYLRNHTNMYYDHIWDLFREVTGENV